MGKTSKSQIKAVRAYEKRNPALTYYQTRRNNARAFVSSSAERFEEASKPQASIGTVKIWKAYGT